MTEPTKYNIGKSYLEGIAQNAIRPFVTRSITGKLLGVNNIYKYRSLNHQYFQMMQKFLYLDRYSEPVFSEMELNAPLRKSELPPSRSSGILSQEQDCSKNINMLSKPQESPALKVLGIHKSGLQSTRKVSRLQDNDQAQSESNNEITSFDKNHKQTNVLLEGNQKVSAVFEEERFKDESLSSELADSELLHQSRVSDEKTTTGSVSKRDFLADLGGLLEANNFSSESEVVSHHQSCRQGNNVKLNNNAEDTGQLSRTLDLAAPNYFQNDTPELIKKLNTIKHSFNKQYKDQDKGLTSKRLANVTVDDGLNISFDQIKPAVSSDERHEQHTLRPAVQEKLSDIGEDYFSDDDEKFLHKNRQDKTPEQDFNSVRRETVIVERNIQQTVLSELPDAFWERSYLGRVNLRIYK